MRAAVDWLSMVQQHCSLLATAEWDIVFTMLLAVHHVCHVLYTLFNPY
jgi:hypothetical protein